jgi:hypothetical protein
MSLHARVAAALGWTEEQTKAFSLLALREMVRDKPKLVAAIERELRTGNVLLGVQR